MDQNVSSVSFEQDCVFEEILCTKVKREILVKRNKQIKIRNPSSCCRRHLLIVAPSATGKSHFVRAFCGENVRVVDADKLVGRLIGWDRLALIPDTSTRIESCGRNCSCG